MLTASAESMPSRQEAQTAALLRGRPEADRQKSKPACALRRQHVAWPLTSQSLLKLEAAEEPRRRPSKRRSDAADVSRLLEEHPDLEQELPGVRERLAHVDDTIRGK